MALDGPIPLDFGQAFPAGAFAIDVSPVHEYDKETKRRLGQARDPVSGDLVWQVSVFDRDPNIKSAKSRTVSVKIAAPVQPVLPPALPEIGMHPVEFEGLTARPYVSNGWVAWSFTARSMRAPGASARQGKAA